MNRETSRRFSGRWVLVGLALCAAGCRDAEPPVVCHVGGTMRPVMQELARIYEKDTGQKVEINSAGSGELLAHIELQRRGDLYVCHDPFLDVLMKRELGVDGWTVGELIPVIVVPKGNPKGIGGVGDLARPEVELALTDYERSTLGHMLETIFTKAGVDFATLNRDKRITINKSGGYVANLVTTGNADAAVVWNAVGHLRLGSLDIVAIPAEHLPTPGVDAMTSATGKDYPLRPVRVTIATLTCAEQPEAARAFAEFVASDRGAEVFKDFGFARTGARLEYHNDEKVE